jgi:hypothetical protein
MNFKKTQLLSDINSAIINTHDCNIFYRKLYFILDDEVENYISSDLYNKFKTEHQILSSLLYSNNNMEILYTIKKLINIVNEINDIVIVS